MRNASKILRNDRGLRESISQNSLRVLPDFLAGFWRGRIKKEPKTLNNALGSLTSIIILLEVN